ncbi:MAG: DUF2158 domain-containing protein [Chitinophagales bacterium]|nr:DUF2158 domain-containing protein [Hyphomicrobiales bacterium]
MRLLIADKHVTLDRRVKPGDDQVVVSYAEKMVFLQPVNSYQRCDNPRIAVSSKNQISEISMSEIKAGDVVVLKSGGPCMTLPI